MKLDHISHGRLPGCALNPRVPVVCDRYVSETAHNILRPYPRNPREPKAAPARRCASPSRFAGNIAARGRDFCVVVGSVLGSASCMEIIPQTERGQPQSRDNSVRAMTGLSRGNSGPSPRCSGRSRPRLTSRLSPALTSAPPSAGSQASSSRPPSSSPPSSSRSPNGTEVRTGSTDAPQSQGKQARQRRVERRRALEPHAHQSITTAAQGPLDEPTRASGANSQHFRRKRCWVRAHPRRSRPERGLRSSVLAVRAVIYRARAGASYRALFAGVTQRAA